MSLKVPLTLHSLLVSSDGLVNQGRIELDQLSEMGRGQSIGPWGVGGVCGRLNTVGVHWRGQWDTAQLQWRETASVVFLRADTGADALGAVTRRTVPFLHKGNKHWIN